jgi:tetratricopeptide (TPR) repeat protein
MLMIGLTFLLQVMPAAADTNESILICPAEGELSPSTENWVRYGFQNYLGDLMRLTGRVRVSGVEEQEGFLRNWISRRSVSFQDMSLQAGRAGYDWILTSENDGDRMKLLAFEVTGATIHQLAEVDPWGYAMDWQDEALEKLEELIPTAGTARNHEISSRAAFENLEQAVWQKNLALLKHGDKSFPDQADWKSAINWIKSAVRADPDHAPTHFHAGHIYHLVRFSWRSVHEFDRFFELAPGAPSLQAEAGRMASEDWYFLGYREWQADNMKEATNSFSRAVNLNPANADAWYWLGRVRMENGDFDGASRAFSHASSLEPGNEKAQYFKERTQKSAKVGGQAWDAFEKGILAYGRGEYEKAYDHFNQAVRHNSNWFEARYWLARVCIVDLNRVEEGRKIVDEMSSGEKQDSRVQYLIKVLKWK